VLAHVRKSKLKGRLQRVVDTVNDHVYVLEDINTSTCEQVHAARMRPYADAQLDVTEDIRDSAAYDSTYYVESIVAWRATHDDELKLKINWLGFDASDASFEPIQAMWKVVPALVARYLRSSADTCEYALAAIEQFGITPPRRNSRRKSSAAKGSSNSKAPGRGRRGQVEADGAARPVTPQPKKGGACII